MHDLGPGPHRHSSGAACRELNQRRGGGRMTAIHTMQPGTVPPSINRPASPPDRPGQEPANTSIPPRWPNWRRHPSRQRARAHRRYGPCGAPTSKIIAGERRWLAAKTSLSGDMTVVIKDASRAAEPYRCRELPPCRYVARREPMRPAPARGDKEKPPASWAGECWATAALLACTPAVLKALTTRAIRLGRQVLSNCPGQTGQRAHRHRKQKVPVAVLKAQLGPCGGWPMRSRYRAVRRLPHNSAGQALFAESWA